MYSVFRKTCNSLKCAPLRNG